MRVNRDAVTFMRPFVLPGHAAELPAGKYEIEYEQEILEGMPSPDWLRTSVSLHLHPKIGSPGLSREIVIPWESLESALMRDQAPAKDSGRLLLDELLSDPLVRLIMLSDNVAEPEVRRVVAVARSKWI